MSNLLLKNTKDKLKDFITNAKFPDNKYHDKLVILKQVVESSLKSALNNIGVGELVEKINKSSKQLIPNRFYNSYIIHDFCTILNGYYPSPEIYLDSEVENKVISVSSVRVNTDWKYPTIKYINNYLNTNYSSWSDIIPNSDIVNIVNLFTETLDYLSKKANCLNKYCNDFGEFLSGINTEEDLMIKYPEIYEYYLEFKKAYPEDNKNILRSGREVKEILEEYRNYLTLVEEKEEVGN